MSGLMLPAIHSITANDHDVVASYWGGGTDDVFHSRNHTVEFARGNWETNWLLKKIVM